MVETNSSSKKWHTTATMLLSGLGVLYFLVQSIGLGLLSVTTYISGQTSTSQTIPVMLLVWSSLLSGLMLLPVFLLSLYQVRSKPLPRWLDTGRPLVRKAALWSILIWPLVILVGWWVADRPSLSVFVLGPLNLLVAGLPVLFIYTLAQRNLDGGSQVRRWRIFGFSLAITPVIIMIVEIIAVLIIAGIGGLWVLYRFSIDPALEQQITALIDQIRLAGEGDPELVLELLKPYLIQPVVIFWAIAIFGGLIPIIEEILKPIALWSLAGRRPSPQEGFVGGLLCGAGFALMENVLYLSSAMVVEDWLYMATGRAGTGVLHMLASGLVGWGLARAWRDGNWFFQGLTLLGAFLLHGFWNALALVVGVLPLFIVDSEMTLGQTFLFNAPMIVLLILSMAAMIMINRKLRRQGASNAGGEDDIEIQKVMNA